MVEAPYLYSDAAWSAEESIEESRVRLDWVAAAGETFDVVVRGATGERCVPGVVPPVWLDGLRPFGRYSFAVAPEGLAHTDLSGFVTLRTRPARPGVAPRIAPASDGSRFVDVGWDLSDDGGGGEATSFEIEVGWVEGEEAPKSVGFGDRSGAMRLPTLTGAQMFALRRVARRPMVWDVASFGGLLLAVAEDAAILRSMTGGDAWTRVLLPTAVPFYRVLTRSAFGLALGKKGAAVVTTNAGASWEELRPFTDADLVTGWVFDEVRAWIASSTGAIFSTSDAGATWVDVSPETTSPILALSAFSNEHVVALDGAARTWTTRDRGATWESRITGAFAGAARSMFFADATTGWIFGSGASDARLWRTDDGAMSWTPLPVPEPPTALTFRDPTTGIMASYSGSVWVTVDGGEQWRAIAENTGSPIIKLVDVGNSVLAFRRDGLALQIVDSRIYQRLSLAEPFPSRWGPTASAIAIPGPLARPGEIVAAPSAVALDLMRLYGDF